MINANHIEPKFWEHVIFMQQPFFKQQLQRGTFSALANNSKHADG